MICKEKTSQLLQKFLRRPSLQWFSVQQIHNCSGSFRFKHPFVLRDIVPFLLPVTLELKTVGLGKETEVLEVLSAHE